MGKTDSWIEQASLSFFLKSLTVGLSQDMNVYGETPGHLKIFNKQDLQYS